MEEKAAAIQAPLIEKVAVAEEAVVDTKPDVLTRQQVN